jgi:hypothetical protein
VSTFVQVDKQSARDMARLFRDLRKASPAVAKETRARFKKAATPALNDARSRQPKLSGNLRRKTKIRISRGRVEIRSSAEYGRISEFGGRHPLWGDRDKWVKHEASPAIFPAANAHRQKFINAANAAVIDAMRKVGRR